MTRLEVAEYLGVPISKIDSMVRQKQLPHLRLPVETGKGGYYLRFKRGTVDEWLESLTCGGDIAHG